MEMVNWFCSATASVFFYLRFVAKNTCPAFFCRFHKYVPCKCAANSESAHSVHAARHEAAAVLGMHFVAAIVLYAAMVRLHRTERDGH